MYKVKRLFLQNVDKQRGVSGVCFLSILTLSMVALWVAFKVLPVYSEYHKVADAMDKVVQLDDIHRYTNKEVINAMQKRLQIDNGWTRNEVDFQKIAYTKDQNGERSIGLNYEILVPFIKNITLLVHFKRETKISLGTK